MAGRKSKLTPETQARILEAIGMGATYELAAQYGGISYDTFNNWMIRGRTELERLAQPNARDRQDEQIYIQFFEAIKEAEGKAAVKWLAKIELAATDGNWQAAAWKLERRYPAQYGRHDVHHSGKVNLEDMSKLSDDELRDIAAGKGGG